MFTAADVAGLQESFTRLGFSTSEIQKVTEGTLALAQASGTDLSTAADVAGATLRAFGLDASETGRVTDVMASSFANSALDMSSFRESMKFVAPVAKSAGLSIEETTAMLGALANNGVKGSQAGTALRRIISDLGGTGANVSKEIDKLAKKGLNLADAKDEVGRTAQTALLILSEAGDTTAELTDKFNSAEGAAKDMANIMNDSAEGGIKTMESALYEAQLAIGSALAPAVNDLVKTITDAANAFSGLSRGTQKAIVATGALLAVLGPILAVTGSLVVAITNMRIARAAATAQQLAAAAASTTEAAALVTTEAATVGATTATNLFSKALKRVPILFAIAGVVAFLEKVQRAKREAQEFAELELQMKAQDLKRSKSSRDWRS